MKEPVGTVCSFRQPFTTGGGSLKEQTYDRGTKANSEVYSAAEAFSGTYRVKVSHISGKTLGDKAKLVVTRFKGTPKESTEFITVDLDPKGMTDPEVSITMEGGRRNNLALIPSPVEMARYRGRSEQNNQVMNKLRALTTGSPSSTSKMAGGVGSPMKPVLADAAIGSIDRRLGEVSWSTRLGAEYSSGLDIRSETTIRVDGNVEVKAKPVFDSGTKNTRVKLDLIPGGE